MLTNIIRSLTLLFALLLMSSPVFVYSAGAGFCQGDPPCPFARDKAPAIDPNGDLSWPVAPDLITKLECCLNPQKTAQEWATELGIITPSGYDYDSYVTQHYEANPTEEDEFNCDLVNDPLVDDHPDGIKREWSTNIDMTEPGQYYMKVRYYDEAPVAEGQHGCVFTSKDDDVFLQKDVLDVQPAPNWDTSLPYPPLSGTTTRTVDTCIQSHINVIHVTTVTVTPTRSILKIPVPATGACSQPITAGIGVGVSAGIIGSMDVGLATSLALSFGFQVGVAVNVNTSTGCDEDCYIPKAELWHTRLLLDRQELVEKYYSDDCEYDSLDDLFATVSNTSTNSSIWTKHYDTICFYSANGWTP